MSILLRVLLLFSLPVFAQAADIPTNVEGTEQLSQEECVANNTNDCIQSVCTTSSELDCNDQCQKSATEKCQNLED